ncbi:MAG: pyridoxal-dependent decarboxylase [Patescibacteria group bacterium]
MKTKLAQFPAKPLSRLKILWQLHQTKAKLQERRVNYNLGWLDTPPRPLAVAAYKYLLSQNPNHLGNWSTPQSQPWATQELEQEVIKKIIHLYRGDQSQLEGYVTSGATEANLYSAWAGRKYLERFVHSNKICLLLTDLTHYSLKKVASIIGVPTFTIPLSPRNWGLSTHGLNQSTKRLYQQGFKAFLLPLTLGYSLTGTSDDILACLKTILKLKRSLPGGHFFVWIDAALNGLVLPFVQKEFAPFASSLVQTFVVDYHKFGQVPYPAGIVLYRKALRQLIEQEIDYLPETDSTVSGSRPGVAAAAIWTVMHSLGKEGYRRLTQSCLANKKLFLQLIKASSEKIKIVTNKNSLACAIIFGERKAQKLPPALEEKYGLYPTMKKFYFYSKTKQEYILYKFYFLPHVTRRLIREFVHDLNQPY